MNKPLRNMTSMALLLALGAVLAQRAAAETPKPALIIAFAGYDQFVANLKTLDQLNHTKLAATVEAGIDQQMNGKGLAGVDKSRPWGLLVTVAESSQPVVEGFLPVTDIKKALAGIPSTGGEAPSANGKGVYEVPVNGKTMYVKEKSKWAVFTDNEDALDSAPAELPTEISALTKKYLLAANGCVQNVPAAQRENALKSLRSVVEFMLLASQQSGSDEQRAMQAANFKMLMASLEKLSKELDTLTIGIGLDTSSKDLFLDVEARAVAGSELAKKWDAMKEAQTDFAGFALPSAAMTMLSSQTSDDEDVAQAKTALANFKTEADKILDANEQLGDNRPLAKKLLGNLLDVAEKTIELKKSDGGMSLVLGDSPLAIAGFRIADGKKLHETLKTLVDKVTEESPQAGEIVKLDAEKHEGVDFTVATLPINDPKAAELLGDKVKIVIGISPSGLYLGAGKDPVTEIKKAIDASKAAEGKVISPVQMIISATPIAKFIAKVIKDENPSAAEAKKNFTKAAELLAKCEGKDHITLTATAIPDGTNMQLKVQSGIIKTVLDLVPGIGSDETSEK